ncbi:Sensor histidine kinase YehU [Paenibacillus konkukensis]|uniref:histidine kinase n=1 Tax=Paenibacillus konkukensis TaxID=2020716 RepID=A0ABY4RK19_9BACL|nr:sensor histidine kinase [Paenibacillus konkukensis]UQZ82180.1 Sensor histidine kinase YehU [Paenibacillus konkukensis]
MRRSAFPFFKPAMNWKIKNKVFSLISLIMVICFMITYFALQYAYSIYDEQLYSKSSQLLNLSSSGIESELKRLERLSFSMATDSQIQSLLLSIDGNTPEFEKLRIRSYISDKLVQYTGYEKYVYSVEVTDKLGEQALAGQSQVVSGAKREMILNESAKGSGESRWILPDGEDATLIIAREIRSYQNQNFSLERIGTLVVRIRLENIVDDVIAGTELKNGEMRIASGDRMIYPPRLDNAGLSLPEAEEWRHGYVIKQLNGRPYFLTQIQSGYLGWSYHSLIPYDTIFNKIILMKRILLIGFIASLLAVMVVAINFARSLTRPIEDLIGRMKQVQKGDFTLMEAEPPDPVTLQMDEVGQLHRTFRMMMQQINELITENYAKQLTIKETQFKALQAQINPHFLYNTLESINWLAKTNGQPQISKMVEALGFLLRSSISLREALITVGEELEIVMCYITIQRFRFEERLEFEMDVPDEARKLMLPKLTLQPLLENSIHYALEQMLEPCLIRIRTKREPGKFIIVVEDNGPGMSAELLEQVRKGEARTRGSGIGLKNIEERIVLAFGEDYGVRLDSEPGKGTSVSIIIPDETGDYDV